MEQIKAQGKELQQLCNCIDSGVMYKVSQNQTDTWLLN